MFEEISNRKIHALMKNGFLVQFSRRFEKKNSRKFDEQKSPTKNNLIETKNNLICKKYLKLSILCIQFAYLYLYWN